MSHPQTEALYNQLNHFLESDQWDRSRDTLAELLAQEPENDWLHYQMGYALWRLDQYHLAEKHLKQAIALNPDDADYYQTLSSLYLTKGQAGKADDFCRKSLQLDPENAETWFLAAHLNVHFDDPQEARKALDRGAQLAPHSSQIHQLEALVGSITPGSGKLAAVQQIEHYQKALQTNPESAYSFYRIGHVHLSETQDYQAAESAFRSALKIDPQDRDYQKALMSALRHRDPVLRILYFPATLATAVFEFYGKACSRIWTLIIFIFAWKVFLVVGLSLYLIFVFLFWPMAKLYEKLTMVEIHKKMGLIRIYKGPFARIHRLPFFVRMAAFSSIFALFWFALFTYFQNRQQSDQLEFWFTHIMTWLLLGVVGLICLYAIYESIRKRFRRRKNAALLKS